MVRILVAWVIIALPIAIFLGRSSHVGSGRRRSGGADDRVFVLTLVALYLVASACILVAAQ